MKTRTDKILLVLTALFVAALAIVAGAISFSHMRELATHHNQLGWKSYAFPISVDGLEIVASLFLVAQRRAGRPTGWVPWLALIVGTAASLAANVAVGGADPIGKAMAGWPALSMLVSVKLLFAMFDHEIGDQRTTVADDQRPSGTTPESERDDSKPSEGVPPPRIDVAAPSAAVPSGRTVVADWSTQPEVSSAEALPSGGDQAAMAFAVDIRDVELLVPAARGAQLRLANAGRSLTRDNLADAMRDQGHGVSNVRASLLLKMLKAESNVTEIEEGPAQGVDAESGAASAAVV